MVAQVLAASLGLVLAISCGNQGAGSLTTHKPTPVYEQPTPAFYQQPNRVIHTIPPGESKAVRQVHYGKDFMMLEVEVSGGNTGFVDSADVNWIPAEKPPPR